MYPRARESTTIASYLRHTAVLQWALRAPYLTTTRPFSSRQSCSHRFCLYRDVWICHEKGKTEQQNVIVIVKEMCNFSLSVLMLLILLVFVKHNKSPHQYYLILKGSLNLWGNFRWSQYNQNRGVLLFVKPDLLLQWMHLTLVTRGAQSENYPVLDYNGKCNSVREYFIP